MQPGTFLDQSVDVIPYHDFVNKELILFSMADLARSIPSAVDGFKPGQRKILFGCFKHKVKKSVKVRALGQPLSQRPAFVEEAIEVKQVAKRNRKWHACLSNPDGPVYIGF